jgi:hypothetical protein
MKLSNRKVISAARRLKPGTVVAIHWLDSGRDTNSKRDKLASRWVYGRVDEVVKEDDTVRIACDVCTGQDEHEDGNNHWGLVWIPSIIEFSKLRPE